MHALTIRIVRLPPENAIEGVVGPPWAPPQHQGTSFTETERSSDVQGTPFTETERRSNVPTRQDGRCRCASGLRRGGSDAHCSYGRGLGRCGEVRLHGANAPSDASSDTTPEARLPMLAQHCRSRCQVMPWEVDAQLILPCAAQIRSMQCVVPPPSFRGCSLCRQRVCESPMHAQPPRWIPVLILGARNIGIARSCSATLHTARTTGPHVPANTVRRKSQTIDRAEHSQDCVLPGQRWHMPLRKRPRV